MNQRDINWHVEPQGIIEVDHYGRINALQPGNAILRVSSAGSIYIKDEKTIQVVEPTKSVDMNPLPKRILNYTGTPAKNYNNFQKLVARIPK